MAELFLPFMCSAVSLLLGELVADTRVLLPLPRPPDMFVLVVSGTALVVRAYHHWGCRRHARQATTVPSNVCVCAAGATVEQRCEGARECGLALQNVFDSAPLSPPLLASQITS